MHCVAIATIETDRRFTLRASMLMNMIIILLGAKVLLYQLSDVSTSLTRCPY